MGFLTRNRAGLALLAILAVAAALRFVDLNRAVAWGDEATVYNMIRLEGPTATIQTLIATDLTRAPFHPLGVEGLFHVFGKSLYMGRLFSAICGVVAVALVYLLGRQAFDRKTALLACGLAALNPLDVHHSRELRMYECLVLATCCSWALLFSFRQNARRWKQAAYVLSLTVMCYTHPLGGLMVIALMVGCVTLWPELRLSRASWLAMHASVGLLLSPWLLNYFDHRPQAFPRELTARLFLEWPEAFTGGNSEVAAAGVALLIFGIVTSRRNRLAESEGARWPIDRVSGALLAWFLVPPVLLAVYSLTRHPIFGERRYLLFVGPAYLLLAARGLSTLPVKARVAVLLGFLFFNVQALDRRVFNIYRPDVRTAASLVDSIDPGATVVVMGDQPRGLSICLKLYRDPALPSPVIPILGLGESLRLGQDLPGEAAWFAIERPKDKPRASVPENLARLYVTDRTYELSYLTLTHNRRIHESASAPTPTRK
jgi:mannosyltransferase